LFTHYNFIFWPWEIKTVESEISKKQEQNGDFAPETPQKLYTQSHTSSYGGSSAIELNHVEMASPSRIHGNNFEDDTTSLKKQIDNYREGADSTLKKFNEMSEMCRDPDEINVEEPSVKASILNCPWAVLPFVFGMFTIVNALKLAGWIDALANAILNVIPADEGNSGHAIAISTFLMATISFVLCTLIDNQPASILLTQVLLAPAFSTLPTLVRTAGMLGVLEGANVGGCWSLMGALAGIMWSTLLRNKGITIGYIQFMRVGLKVMPFVTFMVALIIFAESYSKA